MHKLILFSWALIMTAAAPALAYDQSLILPSIVVPPGMWAITPTPSCIKSGQADATASCAQICPQLPKDVTLRASRIEGTWRLPGDPSPHPIVAGPRKQAPEWLDLYVSKKGDLQDPDPLGDCVTIKNWKSNLFRRIEVKISYSTTQPLTPGPQNVSINTTTEALKDGLVDEFERTLSFTQSAVRKVLQTASTLDDKRPLIEPDSRQAMEVFLHHAGYTSKLEAVETTIAKILAGRVNLGLITGYAQKQDYMVHLAFMILAERTGLGWDLDFDTIGVLQQIVLRDTAMQNHSYEFNPAVMFAAQILIRSGNIDDKTLILYLQTRDHFDEALVDLKTYGANLSPRARSQIVTAIEKIVDHREKSFKDNLVGLANTLVAMP